MNILNIAIGLENILSGALIILVCIPLLKGRVEMNRLYGIRFKKSFESDELWYKINRYGAGRMIFWSVLVILIGVAAFFIPLRDSGAKEILLASAPGLVVIAAVESYLYARKL